MFRGFFVCFSDLWPCDFYVFIPKLMYRRGKNITGKLSQLFVLGRGSTLSPGDN